MSDEINNPKVGIVILNWNNAKDTIECLSSVFKIRYDNYFVILVDNGSTDDSLITISSNFPNIEVLPLKNNCGYAGGNNQGISKAIILGAEYIFILNNDTVVSPSILNELVFIAKANQQIGMIGPKMYCAQPSDLLFAKGSYVLWKNGELLHRGIFKKELSPEEFEFPEIVDFIVGCGVLISKELITQIGGFNEDYFLNFEDVELGIRAKKQGYMVVYVPTAFLWHKISSTLGLASPANTYYMTRNSLLFFSNNAPGFLKFLSPMKIFFRTFRSIFAWTFLSKYKTERYKQMRLANLFALRDFCFRRFGRMGSEVAQACYGKVDLDQSIYQ